MRNKIFNTFSILALVGFVFYLFSLVSSPPQNKIQIHFLSVGQGDAIFIELPKGQNILIDGGPDKNSETELEKFLPFYKKEISSVILTHPHADHLTGLIQIAKDYKIDKFYLTATTNPTPEYLNLLSILKSKKIPTQQVTIGDEIDFTEEIKLRFLYPSKNVNTENINDTSIVSELDWGVKKALFMGDLELDSQQQLISIVKKVDIFKVSHHCSSDAINTEFYQKISPDFSVISVGKNNQFGHPHEKCLNILRNSRVFRTDQDGTINFEMDKNSVREVEN